MNRVLGFFVFLLLAGCVLGPAPEPGQTTEGLEHDLAIIRRLLKVNGIPEADSVSLTHPMGVLETSGDYMPRWDRVVLSERGLDTFVVIPALDSLQYDWILDLRRNDLAAIPVGISAFRHVYLGENRICSPQDTPEKRWLDTLAPPGLGPQTCP